MMAPTSRGPAALRVLVVDDAPLIREALAAFLRSSGMDVVATAPDPAAAIACLVEHRPDVVLLDVRLPPTFRDEGIEVAVEVRRRLPSAGIVLITQDADGDPLGELLRRLPEDPTRLGFLRKEEASGGDRLCDVIREVAGGGVVLTRDAVRSSLAGVEAELTSRELEVLVLMAAGLSNRGIAEELSLSVRTVESNVTRVFQRLGLGEEDETLLNRRVAAVLSYLRSGEPS